MGISFDDFLARQFKGVQEQLAAAFQSSFTSGSVRPAPLRNSTSSVQDKIDIPCVPCSDHLDEDSTPECRVEGIQNPHDLRGVIAEQLAQLQACIVSEYEQRVSHIDRAPAVSFGADTLEPTPTPPTCLPPRKRNLRPPSAPCPQLPSGPHLERADDVLEASGDESPEEATPHRANQPMSDGEISRLLASISRLSLATDQRNRVEKAVRGRRLSCRQAGALLAAIQLGIMQRIVVCDVFLDKLTDLPSSLFEMLAPLPAPIREDIEAKVRGLFATGLAGLGQAKAADRPQELLQVDAEGIKCIDRLRTHALNGNITPTLYTDLSAAFEALNLGPLPLPKIEALS